MKGIFHTVVVVALCLFPTLSRADCWRLPNGQVLTTNVGSTPPVRNAQRVQCPSSQPVQQKPLQLSKQQEKQGVQQTKNVAAAKPAPQMDPCAKYYGKGYCTDYIKERVGRKPSGDAGAWPGNTAITKIRAGDAAIFSIGSSGHVAYVEQVIADKKSGLPISIRISEKNWGKVLSGEENQRCVITSNFGRKSERTVPISTVAKVWRP